MDFEDRMVAEDISKCGSHHHRAIHLLLRHWMEFPRTQCVYRWGALGGAAVMCGCGLFMASSVVLFILVIGAREWQR